MEQDEFKEPIEIMFDAWKPNWKWIKLTLFKFQKAEERVYKNTTYWIFNGKVESKNNPLRIENGALCKFWFSKRLFKQEIQRHLCLHTFDWETPFDVTLEIKRPSKFILLMDKVDITLSP